MNIILFYGFNEWLARISLLLLLVLFNNNNKKKITIIDTLCSLVEDKKTPKSMSKCRERKKISVEGGGSNWMLLNCPAYLQKFDMYKL